MEDGVINSAKIQNTLAGLLCIRWSEFSSINYDFTCYQIKNHKKLKQLKWMILDKLDFFIEKLSAML